MTECLDYFVFSTIILQQLSQAQRSFAKCLEGFKFECIGSTQTDDERVICKSLEEFSRLINAIEDERGRMLDNGYAQVLQILEDFRKKQIGGVKTGKKKFDKQTTKFCQSQERYLNLTVKKQNTVTLQEADASVDMAERHFYNASMEYVYLIQEVHERKKFEFVETLLSFMFSWLTFYHQGYEVAKDFQPYMIDLQCKIQKTRDNFEDYSSKLRKRMAEVQKQTQEEPLRNTRGRKEGYLFLLEKKAFGATWTKQYCTYDKETKKFTMLPYNQLTSKSLALQEELFLMSCVRRMSDSIDKRFCFDLQVDSRPGIVYTFQALSETDRKSWMDIMDGKEPMYTSAGKPQNNEERVLDETGITFVKKCIEVLESRGLEEQGIYRVVGVASKVSKLLNTGLDRRKNDRLTNLDDPQEWETKTITSALKNYLRNLPEPLMTYRYHNGFIAAVKSDSRQMRINDVHALVYRIPKLNFDVLKILIKHLTRVASKSDKNLMTISNLGVCFGPTLLRPEEETVASIMDLKFYNIVVEILIENYDKIFNSEPTNNVSPEKLSPQTGNDVNHHIGSVSNSHSVANAGTKLTPIYITTDTTENNYNPYKTYPSNHVNNSARTFQPYTCSVRTYVEPPGSNISASLVNVHDPQTISMYYNMSRSERSPNNTHQSASHRKMAKLGSSGISSQSESNIPGMQSCSPTNFRIYGKLAEQNSASSSNESVSSNSRDSGNNIGHTSLTPEKTKRSNIGMSYPKGYRPQGAVACDTVRKTNISTSATSSGRSSPSFAPVRRVRTLYACLGENDGELSFEPNQIITNVKQSQEPGWLEGTLNGKTGLIPENYVEMLP
ncbi:Pleckstrin homology domain containing protein [Oryctes borbonicus]|uniref:Pleckstrin homology domain containing protein n=1 Tax=Oryctes borbonicus TaxID=1629725 RepID=A0A0T6AW09_9SCAR|nr:Pleckstrin homology domain containing protein [Oryctes borbonicus]